MADAPKELTQEHIEMLLHDLRSIGLYENRVRRLSTPEEAEAEDEVFDLLVKPSVREVVILDLFVGDNAFLPRVQAPEQAAVDTRFASLARQFGEQEDDTLKAEIADKLAMGINPFDEDDDADR